tara:strand:+ start:173 stop:772 length:600 start_codon:yes stop_codon:yes gene_type:complete
MNMKHNDNHASNDGTFEPEVSIPDLIAEARRNIEGFMNDRESIDLDAYSDLLSALESVTGPTESERIQWAPSGDVTQGKPEEVAQFLASSDGKVRGYAWGTGLGFIFQTEHGPIEVQPGDWISRTPDGRFVITSVTAPTAALPIPATGEVEWGLSNPDALSFPKPHFVGPEQNVRWNQRRGHPSIEIVSRTVTEWEVSS